MNLGFAAFHAGRDAVRSLWAYRLRTVLTSLGVTVGVATVIAIFSVIEGLNFSFKAQVSALGTGTLYVSQMPWLILGDWWRYQKRPRVTMADADVLEDRIEGATVVVPFVDQRSNIEVGRTSLRGVRVIGSTANWPEMSGVFPNAGRFFARGDVEAGREVVVVGADAARILSAEGLVLGDSIRIGDRPAQVIGMMPERGRVFGQSQDDYVVVPLSVFQRWFGVKRSVTIGVVVDPEDLDRYEDEIVGAMRLSRRLRPEEEDTFSVNQQQMFVELYQTLTGSLYATAIGLGFITLIVGGVGIMNIMLVAVAERTREIGIRKALGARPMVVLAQFVVEAAIVSGLGGMMGTLMGMVMARLVASFTPLPAEVPSIAIPLGIAFGLSIGLIFGFMPALRASRLLPVQALGHGA